MKSKNYLELYVHIPFCVKKCAYCDFLSFSAEESVHRAYMKKLMDEIRCMGEIFKQQEIVTIFIGGGTPSMIEAGEIRQLMETIRQSFIVDETAEITIEANPGTLSLTKLNTYRESGINRVSLGLQSANVRELKKLGRIHSFEDFLDSYQKVRQVGFQNVNVDLISGLPGQSLSAWKNTLKKVVMLRPEHISAYSLILEQGTPFYNWYYNYPHLLPDEDTERGMYRLTRAFLAEHGYDHYEISNYAKPGYECRHNVGYWTGLDYLGVGLGASSYVGKRRFHNENDLQTYLKMTDLEQLHQDVEQLDEKAQIEEFMFLGLRLMKGVSAQKFLKKFGQNMWDFYKQPIEKLKEDELIEVTHLGIHLTDRGNDLSNYVFQQFLLD